MDRMRQDMKSSHGKHGKSRGMAMKSSRSKGLRGAQMSAGHRQSGRGHAYGRSGSKSSRSSLGSKMTGRSMGSRFGRR